MGQTLAIRADANATMGTGHVMRCLALAETWMEQGGQVALVSAELPEFLQARASQMNILCRRLSVPGGSPQDAVETVRAAQELQARWLAIDGYHFSEAYQRQLGENGPALLWLDDFGQLESYAAELVLNQNLHATAGLYRNKSLQTILLLGHRFVLLRREFRKWRQWRRTFATPPRRILVTLGGSDPENVTLRVGQALQRLGAQGFEVDLVVGGSYPHLEQLRRELPGDNFRIRQNAKEMPELMARADLAIGAGGTTAWEFAFMGLPAMMTILAENQALNCEQMARYGAAVNLGWHHALRPSDLADRVLELVNAPERLQTMSVLGRQLIDGYGNSRVWMRMNADRLPLRAAEPTDCRRVWEWVNEPELRAVSLSPAPIPWESHQDWFQKRLSKPDSVFWIVEDPVCGPVGYVRFDLAASEAEISIGLAKQARGRNLGGLAIWLASKRLFEEKPQIGVIRAIIKPENAASVRAFQKAGYGQPADAVEKGIRVLGCKLTREECML